jgi:hypothetical protein
MPAPDPVPAFAMTDLEAELMGPSAQAVRAALLERFGALQARIQQDMKAGLATAEFSRAGAMGLALAAAKEIVLLFPAKA